MLSMPIIKLSISVIWLTKPAANSKIEKLLVSATLVSSCKKGNAFGTFPNTLSSDKTNKPCKKMLLANIAIFCCFNDSKYSFFMKV